MSERPLVSTTVLFKYYSTESESESQKWSRKSDGTGVGRIRKFSFSSNSAYDSVAYDQVKTRLSESEVEEER